MSRKIVLMPNNSKSVEYARENWPADRWPNFTFDEWACSHTGQCLVNPTFMDALQWLRDDVAQPLTVTSGYRHITHPIETAKILAGKRPGAHTSGKAVDLRVSGDLAYRVLDAAFKLNFTGIGISQAGEVNKRFIHLDQMTRDDGFPRPTIWSY